MHAQRGTRRKTGKETEHGSLEEMIGQEEEEEEDTERGEAANNKAIK